MLNLTGFDREEALASGFCNCRFLEEGERGRTGCLNLELLFFLTVEAGPM